MCHRAPTKQGPKQSRRERFLPGSGPTKTPLKVQSLQLFFWSNSMRTYSGKLMEIMSTFWIKIGSFFFFLPHIFLSFMFVRAHPSNKPTAPKSRGFGLTILFFGFPPSTNRLGKWRCGQKSIQKVAKSAPPYNLGRFLTFLKTSIGNVFEHWTFKALLPAQQLLFQPLVLRLHGMPSMLV